MRARRLWLGFMTVLGLARRGFFIPYRYAAGVSLPASGPAYPAIEGVLREHEAVFRAAVLRLQDYGEALRRIGVERPPAPRWDQDWFPRLDAAMAYAMVRAAAPRRIVEVGAGHSTRFFARAVADGGLDTRLTAIDPAPRAVLEGVPVGLVRARLEQADPALFAELKAGDVLSVDSSHILMPGTDVDRLLNAILPALPADTLVHFHDIFLPDDYPSAWAWRAYNEQLGVAQLLLGGAYQPLFASHYVVTRMADLVASGVLADLSLSAGAFESGLWLRKR
ncbi:MAG: class I SAM-dependent methyltransferase [Alphaproteobacteria bacterium]